MDSNYYYRLYENKDFDKYKELYKDVYNKEIDKDYFLWKHSYNINYLGNPLIYLIFNSDNELIGANSFFTSHLNIDGEKKLCVQSGDTMVTKEYRGKGLFKKVITYAMDDLKSRGYNIIYGFANNNSVFGFNKLNFKTIYTLNIYYKIFSYSKVLKERFNNNIVISGAGKIIDGVTRLSKFINFDKDVKVETLQNINEEFIKFIEENKSYKISFEKDVNILNVKYCSSPKNIYDKLVLKKNNKIIGYAILKISDKKGLKSAALTEYWIDKTINVSKMIKTLSSFYKNQNYDYIEIIDTGIEQLGSSCKKNGFIKRKIQIYFIVKSLDEINSQVFNIGNWHVVNGDIDTA